MATLAGTGARARWTVPRPLTAMSWRRSSTWPDSGRTDPALRLTSRDVVVAAPPCGDPDVYTSLLDLALAAGAAVVAAPLAQVPATVSAYKGTAAVVPRGTDVPGLPAGRVFAVG